MKRLVCLIVLLLAPYIHPKPSSYPYISGDTFRNFADFVVDEVTCRPYQEMLYPDKHPKFIVSGKAGSFDPKQVTPERNIIFVRVHFMEYFFSQLHPKIACPYILITHNGDRSAPWKFLSYLDDDKLLAWFAKNPDRVHEKLIPLPIGVPNRNHKLYGNCVKTFDIYQKSPVPFGQRSESNLLLMNFRIATNADERNEVHRIFSEKPFCANPARKNNQEYLRDMAHFVFILCPEGNGVDCHRTWEALYMGCIPVVTNSLIDPIFQDLPVLIIDDWHKVTKEFLEEKQKSMSSMQFNTEKLYADYWFNLIKSYQQKTI